MLSAEGEPLRLSLLFLKSQHSFRHKNDELLKLQILPQEKPTEKSENDDDDSSQTIEHYECCHKPLPEYTNVDSLREVHEALGFI